MEKLAVRTMSVRARLRSGERATTMVEYALLVALVALACVGPLRSLSDRTNERFSAASDDLERRPAPEDGDGGSGGGGRDGGGSGDGGNDGGGNDGGSGGDGNDGGGSGGDDGGPGGDDSGGDDGDPDGGEEEESPGVGTDWTGSSQLENEHRWQARATVTVRGGDGQPLSGVNAGVQVRVVQVYRTWDGKVEERSWTDLGNLQAGAATFTLGNLATGRKANSEAILAMRYEVTGIDYYWPRDPVQRWDGVQASVAVAAP